MKNKHGAMEIVLFVFLVLLAVSVALFTFGINPPYTKVNVYDVRFVESVYQKQDLAEFYIRQVGEKVKNSENFEEDFIKEFDKYDFGGGYLKELQKIISEEKFGVFISGDTLEVIVDSWELEDSFGKIKIKYTPKISVKFDLKQKVN